MHAAVMERASGQDAIVMSAAVADYTPAEPAPQKVKKADGPVTITLNRTEDILGELGKLPSRKQRLAGAGRLCRRNQRRRGLRDLETQTEGGRLIVANDVSRTDAGFDVETNAVTLVSASGAEELPLQAKMALRRRILDRIEQFLVAVPAKNAPSRRNDVARAGGSPEVTTKRSV